MTNEVLELALFRNSTLIEHSLKNIYQDLDFDIHNLVNAELYSLLAGGKRIRPTLCLEFCKLFDGNEEDAIPFATALEMVHTYSLIHDDLPCMDNDDFRRGKPSCHIANGESTALLAGDALLTGAFEVMSNAPLKPEIVLCAIRFLSNSIGREGMIGGQVIDLEGEKEEFSSDKMLKMFSMKTGALITASCVLGALSAGISFTDERMKNVIEYSENIGLAFQIKDDILDVIGNAEKMGKTLGKDKKENKNSFLKFYSLEEAKSYCDFLTKKAISSLSTFPNSDLLTSLALWLTNREK